MVLGRLHLITDTRPGRDPLRLIPAALDAGIDAVQVRVKDQDDGEVLRLVEAVLELCAPYRACCIVDDRLDVALVARAQGVHLGEHDLPVGRVRGVGLPEGFVVGATARDPESATARVAEGASYLGTGPVYATSTKAGLPSPIGVDGLAAVCRAVAVPVIAIGGITAERVPELLAAGAYGIAVVGAVSDAEDPAGAARALVAAVRAAQAQ
jgi:thiamine-phosphate pyrophosphorylase